MGAILPDGRFHVIILGLLPVLYDIFLTAVLNQLNPMLYPMRLAEMTIQGITIPACKGNLTTLRRILHLDLAKGNPKRTL
jgi:hypothetical protein